ncbi:MAG: helix-turn-helix domain-containing protein [bacterium]
MISDQEKSNVRNPDLMTLKQAADYLGMSSAWMYQKKYSVPHRKIGGIFFFSKSALDKWLAGGSPDEALHSEETKKVRSWRSNAKVKEGVREAGRKSLSKKIMKAGIRSAAV